MESSKFQCVWGLATRLQQSGDTVQTKQDLLCSILLQHFSNRGSSSRSKAIVFAQYRRMVTTIEATLNRHSPIIQARSFVGQAASNGAAGMNQEEQRELVEQFRSSDGECNVLVATSIGEEGLDIGEVDIIVQYDCVSSHIRSVQRIGRTGRKRDGRAIQLVSAGREQEALAKQRKTANAVKQTLSRNAKWKYHPLGAYPMLGPLPPPELHVRKLNQPESRPSSNLGAVRAVASSSNHVGSAKAMNGVALQVDQNTCVPTSTSHSDGDRSVPLAAETATQPAAPLQSQRRESSSGLSAAPDNDDIDLEAIATRFPLSCSVPSVTRRLGHSKLTHLLYTACVDTGGLDEKCGAHGQPSPERTQDESDTIDLTTETNADTHIREIACSGHSASSFPVDSLAEAAKDAAGRRSSGRSDAYSSELVELLEILPSHGCESTFAPCPPEIRHLLPDFVNVSRASALSGYGRRGQMRRPSYMSDLHDHNVRPPPDIRSELRSTGAAAVSVTAPTNPGRVGSGISEVEVNPEVCVHNPSNVDSSVSTAGSGAAQPRAAPVAPAGRGLTEQQRRRIAENRKKAQARRAQAKAEQAAITSAASAGQASLTSKSEPAHAATSERDEGHMLSAETPEPSNVSQQIDASDDSEFEAPARSAAIGPSDSDLVLSSSPSPAVMGRLRKGAGTKMPKKKRSRLPDAHSQSDTRETSRAAGAGRRTRRRKQQFADTEAAVSDGDSSDGDSLDEDGAAESDGMGDFLVDSMTQPLDIAGSSPEGRPSQGRSSDCSDDSECSQRAARPQHMDMGDVYRRSLFSQDADEMGFASPP